MHEIFSGTKPVDETLIISKSNLQQWMNENIAKEEILSIEQFKGGQSNPTYKVITQHKNYVLRRKPPGKLLPSAHAVDREYAVISALQDTPVPVPRSFGMCHDEDVAGTPFFMMEFLDGIVHWDLLLPNMTNEERAKIYAEKNRVLAALHSVDFQEVGLQDFGKPGNYVARQVSRWTKQYLASETQKISAMNNLIEWLPENIPNDDETSIVHGDYRLDNMIFDKKHSVMGVLDWELSTLGHPIADFSYHCLSWRTIPLLSDENFCKSKGIPTEYQYRDMYSDATGKDLSTNWEFYIIFNIFKIAAICQGILGRVRDGTASSKHAEERGNQVFPLSEAAWASVEKFYK
ncbi:MAG: phosphotransferase family protein [Gammaproteobacteria bacterium]